MPASVIAISGRRGGTREGMFVLLETALPQRPPRNIGVERNMVLDQIGETLRHFPGPGHLGAGLGMIPAEPLLLQIREPHLAVATRL